MNGDTVLNFDYSQSIRLGAAGAFFLFPTKKGWLVVLVGSNGFKQQVPAKAIILNSSERVRTSLLQIRNSIFA